MGRRITPFDEVHVDTFLEQIADQGTVLLQVGDHMAVDQGVANQPGYLVRLVYQRQVVMKLEFVLPIYRLLGGGSYLDVLFLEVAQEFKTLGYLAVDFGDLFDGIARFDLNRE